MEAEYVNARPPRADPAFVRAVARSLALKRAGPTLRSPRIHSRPGRAFRHLLRVVSERFTHLFPPNPHHPPADASAGKDGVSTNLTSPVDMVGLGNIDDFDVNVRPPPLAVSEVLPEPQTQPVHGVHASTDPDKTRDLFGDPFATPARPRFDRDCREAQIADRKKNFSSQPHFPT